MSIKYLRKFVLDRYCRAMRRRAVRKVSVVSVTYNCQDSIRLTLESVRRQSHDDVEHVLIDGASKDDTMRIVREYAPAYCVSERDGGIYDAMDKGAQAARGDIVIFLNAGDTFYDRDVCRSVVEFFNGHEADIVFGDLLPVYLNVDDSHSHPSFEGGKLLRLDGMRNRRQLYDQSIHHQATFFRRHLFRLSTYKCEFPDATGEYHLIVRSVFAFGARIRYVPLPVSRFALGGQSTNDFAAEYLRYTSARDILRRLYMPPQLMSGMPDVGEFSS